MSIDVIAKRYAKALFLQAEKLKLYDELGRSLCLMVEVFSLETVQPILRNPFTPKELKKTILTHLTREHQATKQISEGFVDCLVNAKRVQLLPQIFKIYQKLLDEKDNVVRGEVATVYGITEETSEQLASLVGQKLGKTVKLSNVLNPEILGGFRVKIDHDVLDFSIQSKLGIILNSS